MLLVMIPIHSSLQAMLLEGDLFFMQQGNVYTTLRKLTQSLAREGIDYAIIGGMALVAHGYARFTQDVGVLMTPDGLNRFRQQLVGRGFTPAFTGATKMYRDPETGVAVEIILSGEFPGDGRPKSIRFPEPTAVSIDMEGIQVVKLETLIELKLASGLNASDCAKDIGDVQELIRVLKLSADVADQLDSSVRSEYLRLWQGISTANHHPSDS